MSKDKEIINKLFEVVAKQQQIITKIAQNLGEPVQLDSGAPPTGYKPQETTKKEAAAILAALPPNVRATIKQLEVAAGRDSNVVKVQFLPQRGNAAVFNVIKNTVTDLQNKNVLPGQSYNIVEVA